MQEILTAFLSLKSLGTFWFLIAFFFVYWTYINYQVLFSNSSPPHSSNELINRRNLIKSGFRHLYDHRIKYLLNGLTKYTNDSNNFHDSTDSFFKCQPFTSGSYEFCLKIAFLYPFLLFYTLWIAFDSVDAGVLGIKLLNDDFANKFYSFLFIITFITATLALSIREKNHQRSIKIQSILIFIYITVSAITSITFKNSGIITAIGSITGSVIIGNFFYARRFSVYLFLRNHWHISPYLLIRLIRPIKNSIIKNIGIGTGFGMLAGTFLSHFLYFEIDSSFFSHIAHNSENRILTKLSYSLIFLISFITSCISVLIIAWAYGSLKDKNKFLFWILYNILYFVVIYFLADHILKHEDQENHDELLIIFFFITLPQINALIDWISLNFTRYLLHDMVVQNHNGWVILFLSIIDIIFALLFILVLFIILLITFYLVQCFSGSISNSTTIFKIFEELNNKNNYWVYLMLATTIIPTFIHFCIAIWYLPVSLISLSRKKKNILQDFYRSSDAKHWALVYLTLKPLCSLLFVIIVLAGLYSFIKTHYIKLFQVLKDILASVLDVLRWNNIKEKLPCHCTLQEKSTQVISDGYLSPWNTTVQIYNELIYCPSLLTVYQNIYIQH